MSPDTEDLWSCCAAGEKDLSVYTAAEYRRLHSLDPGRCQRREAQTWSLEGATNAAEPWRRSSCPWVFLPAVTRPGWHLPRRRLLGLAPEERAGPGRAPPDAEKFAAFACGAAASSLGAFPLYYLLGLLLHSCLQGKLLVRS